MVTNAYKQPAIRRCLRGVIRSPCRFPRPKTLIPALGPRPWQVAMAFEIALQFGLRARYAAVGSQTAWQRGARLVAQSSGTWDLRNYRRFCRRVTEAVEALEDLRKSPRLSTHAARACFEIAMLQAIARGGDCLSYLWSALPITRTQVTELQGLFGIVPWDEFRPEQQIVLTPTIHVGRGVERRPAAELDLLIDAAIADCKVLATQQLHRNYVAQLVAYAVLARRHHVTPLRRSVRTNTLAVYFARAGVLHRFSLWDCIHPEDEQLVHDVILRRKPVRRRSGA